MKPAPLTHYGLPALIKWLAAARPALLAYLQERTIGRAAGSLICLALSQNAEDMRAFPAAYERCGYTADDLDWLRAELGDEPSVHVWW